MAEPIKSKKLDLRQLLEEVAEDEGVDQDTRKLARDKMKLMDVSPNFGLDKPKG